MADIVTPEWMRIAAEMIDARKVSIGSLSTPDDLQAGSFIFDNGIFYLGVEGMQTVKAMLLKRYERERVPS